MSSPGSSSSEARAAALPWELASERTAPAAAPAEVFSAFLSSVLGATEAGPAVGQAAERPGALFALDSGDLRSALAWLLRGPMAKTVAVRSADGKPIAKADVCRCLGNLIARIDGLLNRQVNAILHHPRFQQLEASWRSLWRLARQAAEAVEESEAPYPLKIKIRVLSVSRRQLQRDFERAVEFDQSEIFRRIYGDEYDSPGGQPYGVMLADYQFGNSIEDIEALGHLAAVGAAAFCPVVAAAAPKLLGLANYQQLEQPVDLSAAFQTPEYLKWRALRESEDSRFLGLTAPSVLMRTPYELDGSRVDGFVFKEETTRPDGSEHLWGSAAYAFGSVLVNAFANGSWFADIRGVARGELTGGVVTDLPVASHATDRRGVAPKMPTQVALTEQREQELASLGFIPLCRCPDTPLAAFYSNQSVQIPKTYADPVATVNAKLSAMLQYTLCVSRFAHYLKVICRDKIGGLANEQELEDDLNRWITEYVAADEKANPAVRAKWPLREAKVDVRPVAGSPGAYRLTMHLLPHFQPDTVTVALKLVTRVSTGK